MSSPNDPTPDDDAPRFGQRSSGWTPENPTGVPPTPASDTPWPQYGQTSGSSSGSTGGAPWPQAGTPGAPTGPQQGAGPQFGAQSPQGPGAGGQSSYGQSPYGQSPYGQSPYGQPGPGMPQAPMGSGPLAGTQDLPSRAWAIVLIVVGVLTATVLAFAAFMTVLLTGSGFQDLVGSASAVTSGSTVTVDQSGSYIVSATGGESITCSLEGSDGSTHDLQAVSGESSAVMGMNIPAGQYTLTCTGSGSSQLVGMTGVDASSLTSAGVRSMVWGTVVGVIGIAMTIGGIVWLVRVNKRRREIQRGQWQMGPYRA